MVKSYRCLLFCFILVVEPVSISAASLPFHALSCTPLTPFICFFHISCLISRCLSRARLLFLPIPVPFIYFCARQFEPPGERSDERCRPVLTRLKFVFEHYLLLLVEVYAPDLPLYLSLFLRAQLRDRVGEYLVIVLVVVFEHI